MLPRPGARASTIAETVELTAAGRLAPPALALPAAGLPAAGLPVAEDVGTSAAGRLALFCRWPVEHVATSAGGKPLALSGRWWRSPAAGLAPQVVGTNVGIIPRQEQNRLLTYRNHDAFFTSSVLAKDTPCAIWRRLSDPALTSAPGGLASCPT